MAHFLRLTGKYADAIEQLTTMMKYLSDKRTWVVVGLNALNAVVIWMLYNWPLTTAGKWVLTVCALANAFLGTWLIYKIAKDPTQPKRN